MQSVSISLLTIILTFLTGTKSLDYSGSIDSSVIPENASIIFSVGGYKTVLSEMGPSAQIPKQAMDVIDGDLPAVICISIDEWDGEYMDFEDFIEKNILLLIPIDVGEDELLAMIKKMGGKMPTTLNNGVYKIENDMYFTIVSGDESDFIAFSTTIPTLEGYMDTTKIPDSTTDQGTRIMNYLTDYGSKIASLYVDKNVSAKMEIYGEEMGLSSIGVSEDDYSALMSQYDLDMDWKYAVGYINDLALPFEGIFLTELSEPFTSTIFDVERVADAVYLPDDPFVYMEFKILPTFVSDMMETLDLYGMLGVSPNQVSLFETALSGSFVGAVYPRAANFQTLFSTPSAFVGMVGVEDKQTMQTILDLLVPYRTSSVQNTTVYQFNAGYQYPNMNIYLGDDILVVASDQKYMSQYLENVSNDDDSFGDWITTTSGANRIMQILLPDAELLNQGIAEMMRNARVQAKPFTIESISLTAEVSADEQSFGYYFEIE